MTLPTSGPLSLDDIQTEFGGSNPISLNEYYAGGAYVIAGTTGTYGAVPSSGTISIQNFYGTSKVYVNFNNVTVNSSGTSRGVTAAYQIKNDGFDYVTANGSVSVNQQWVTPLSQGGNFEVYATLTSGTASGTFGSWLATTSTPSWNVVATSGSTVSAVITMQVRRTGSTTTIDTWTVSLTASQG